MAKTEGDILKEFTDIIERFAKLAGVDPTGLLCEVKKPGNPEWQPIEAGRMAKALSRLSATDSYCNALVERIKAGEEVFIGTWLYRKRKDATL